MVEYEYVVNLEYNGSHWLIGCSSDDKEFYATSESKILIFDSEKDALNFTRSNDINLEDDGTYVINIKKVRVPYIMRLKERRICKIVEYWNIADNICNSLHINSSIIKGNNDLYDKLFWSMNLAPVTPEGEKFTPKYTIIERMKLRKIMKDVYRLFDDIFI